MQDCLVIDKLPSNFRYYKDLKSVKVRGLYYDEVLLFSKYISDDVNFSQIVSLYEDIIQGIDVKKLELIDFLYLVILSNLGTVEKYQLYFNNIVCENCKHRNETYITTDKLKTKDPIYQGNLPTEINDDLKIKPFLVEDLEVYLNAEKEQYEKQLGKLYNELTDKDFKKLLNKVLFVESDKSIGDRISDFFKLNILTIKDIDKMYKEIDIDFEKIDIKCKNCEESISFIPALKHLKVWL